MIFDNLDPENAKCCFCNVQAGRVEGVQVEDIAFLCPLRDTLDLLSVCMYASVAFNSAVNKANFAWIINGSDWFNAIFLNKRGFDSDDDSGFPNGLNMCTCNFFQFKPEEGCSGPASGLPSLWDTHCSSSRAPTRHHTSTSFEVTRHVLSISQSR